MAETRRRLMGAIGHENTKTRKHETDFSTIRRAFVAEIRRMIRLFMIHCRVLLAPD
jgi:hypothetical protein